MGYYTNWIAVLLIKKTISSGVYGSISINNTQVWCWGNNSNGQLGDNSIINKCTPISILGNKKTFCEISAGHRGTLALDNYNHVWGWGYNNNGQLGDNSILSRLTPVRVCNF